MQIIKGTKKAKEYKKQQKIKDEISKLAVELSRLQDEFFKEFIKTDYFKIQCKKCESILKYSVNDLCKYNSENVVYIICCGCDEEIILPTDQFSSKMLSQISEYFNLEYSSKKFNSLSGIYKKKFDLEFNKIKKVIRIKKKMKRLVNWVS